MKKFIVLFITALSLGAAAVPSAAFVYGKDSSGFWYGGPNTTPQLIAGLVRKSVAMDSSGNTRLADAAGDPGKCRRDGSCGTPNWILTRLREIDPQEGPKNLSELADYLDELVMEPGRPGPYYSDCGKPDGRGGYTVAADCFQRPFKPGEKAWVHKTSKRVVFLADCSNTTRGPAPLPTPVVVDRKPPVTTAQCPELPLVAHAWSEKTISEKSPEVYAEYKRLVGIAAQRRTEQATNPRGFLGDDVSRSIGGRLRREVKEHEPLTVDIPVQLRDLANPSIVRPYGTIKMVNGIGRITVTSEARNSIIETIWPADFNSPLASGPEDKKVPRLWVFPDKKGDIWNEKCEPMNIHGVRGISR